MSLSTSSGTATSDARSGRIRSLPRQLTTACSRATIEPCGRRQGRGGAADAGRVAFAFSAGRRVCPRVYRIALRRDSAYHQGTVWAWLIGPFISAYRRVHAGEADLDQQVRTMLSAAGSELSTAGLGQVSEIFDGDAPHTPRGCPAEAWSVAELLRVLG